MPRLVPSIATTQPQPSHERFDPVLEAIDRRQEESYLDRLALARSDVYALDGPFSYFRDLAAIEESRVQHSGTFAKPRFSLLPGPPKTAPGITWPTAKEAQQRLDRSAREQRDLTSSTGSVPDLLRPSMPGALAEIFGKAARRTSALAQALSPIPLEAGMVDNTGSQLVVKVPALATGTAVGAHADNAAVTELDPTSASISSPVASIAGQVDAARQLVEFSQPKIDAVLSDDLGARLGEAIDAQIINGSGGAANMRGFLQVSGILSVTGSVTNATAYLGSLWQAYSQVAGASGYGDGERTNFLTLIHPRRFAWLQAGFSTPVAAALPGTVVIVPNAPTNQGAGTNEDTSLVVDRTAVQLVADSPRIRAYEETGSSALTIRYSATANAALIVLNAKAVAKVTGGTPPSGF